MLHRELYDATVITITCKLEIYISVTYIYIDKYTDWRLFIILVSVDHNENCPSKIYSGNHSQLLFMVIRTY